MNIKEQWDLKHKESQGRFNRVTDFAKLCYFNFLKNKSTILDLGCGKGADAIFFHNKGMKVTALDYSTEAITQFNEIQKKYGVFITTLVKDITEPLPFQDNSFDAVYSRAVLYYFTDEELKKIFSEINRVLKSEGLLMFQVKSINDKDFGKGKEVENNMYEAEDYARHFFGKEYAASFLQDYNIILNEERKLFNGAVYLEIVAEKLSVD